MSIINDALRKTQDDLARNENKEASSVKFHSPSESPPPPEPVSQTQVATKSQKARSNFFGALLFVLSILIIASCGVVIFLLYQTPPPPKTMSSQIVVQQTLPPLPPPPVEILQNSEPTLNGTMMMGDQWVALINNQIYEVGATVNGMEVINISLEEVELRGKDETVVLSTKTNP